MNRIAMLGGFVALLVVTTPGEARPIGGGFAPGGVVGHGPSGGALLGVDGAWSDALSGPAGGRTGWAFGARGGYAFASGLELHLRYDDLGVTPPLGASPLQLATGGIRYAVPFLFPMPFAEVDVGPAFALGGVDLGVGGALGLSFPVVNHVLVDVVARDWFVPLGGTTWQILTVGLGLAVTFGGPR